MDYRRHYQPGGTYFFTVATGHRQPLLIGHIDRLRQAFRHYIDRHPFEIQGIVILLDHLHTIWRLPDCDRNFSTRWIMIKRKFSAELPAKFVYASLQAHNDSSHSSISSLEITRWGSAASKASSSA